MKLPRMRFTVRRMIVAVAVLGGIAGVETMRRRSNDLRGRAEFHKWEVCAIEEELPPDPDHRWEAYWFSDDPGRRHPAAASVLPARLVPSFRGRPPAGRGVEE